MIKTGLYWGNIVNEIIFIEKFSRDLFHITVEIYGQFNSIITSERKVGEWIKGYKYIGDIK